MHHSLDATHADVGREQQLMLPAEPPWHQVYQPSEDAVNGLWSTVLDCCWHFSNTGDQCLGTVVTGLDPTGLDFHCVPTHFGLDNPMGNPHVKRTMKITFGDFLDEHPDFT